MTDKEQKKAAKEFTACWEGRDDEKQETQLFWIDLLQTCWKSKIPHHSSSSRSLLLWKITLSS